MNCDFEKYRKLIAWCEIAGVLHDVGKLSGVWLKYRRLWQEKGNAKNWNWGNDPHNHDFFKKWDVLFKNQKSSSFMEQLKKVLSSITEYGKSHFGEKYDLLNLEDVANKHENISLEAKTFLSQLRIADSIDSAWDRNNPLFCREQKDEKPFDTEVFGHECTTSCESTIALKNGIPDYTEHYLHGAPPKPHIVTGQELDEKRKELYEYLNDNNRLSNYLENLAPEERLKILGAIRHAFDYGMADTNRPGNDTTLWEHAYSTATLFKAAVIRSMVTREFYDGFGTFRFKLIGVGWNGLAYMANSPKLGDALGRQKKLIEIVDTIRKTFEWEQLWGSLVYWDINQVVFLVPDDDNHAEIVDSKQVKTVIKQVFRDVTNGDLFPSFHFEKDCFSLTSIVKVTDALRNQRHIPVRDIDETDLEKLKIENPAKKDICPVCRRRIVDNYGRCDKCFERMSKSAEELFKNKSTAFPSEIIRGNEKPGNNRVALVVAHFGFRNWLGGRMHRSMMVTEADGIEKEIGNLWEINRIKDDDKRKELRSKWQRPDKYKFNEILEEVREYIGFFPPTDANDDKWFEQIDSDAKDKIFSTMFIYGRRNGTDPKEFLETCRTLLDNFKKEYPELSSAPEEEILAAALCTKTPTPSTLLDTWHAPYRFVKDLAVEKAIDDKGNWLGCIGTAKRQIIDCTFETPIKILNGCAYLCDNEAGNRFEAVFLAEQQDNGNKRTGYVIGGRFENSSTAYKVFEVEGTAKRELCNIETIQLVENATAIKYYPVREVLLSPDLAMFLVPADKAFSVAAKIKQMFDEEFSKVRGRLPFNIGLLYFQYKHPVYLVLDAARRMVEGFEKREGVIHQGNVIETPEKKVEEKTENNDSKKIIRRYFDIKIETCKKDGAKGRTIPFDMEYALGDGTNDCHHPYVYVKTENSIETRPSYFKTVGFDSSCLKAAPAEDKNRLYGIINVKDLENGDTISFTPSAFDFELLDTIESRHSVAYDSDLEQHGLKARATRSIIESRHSVAYDSDSRRRSIPFQFRNKPYYLEEIDVFKIWWERLKSKDFFGRKITDTELRGLERLWLQKMDEWEVDLNHQSIGKFASWKLLVETSLKDTFPAFREMESKKNIDRNMPEHFQETVAVVTSGLLLDVLQLFFHIQKEKVADVKRTSDK